MHPLLLMALGLTIASEQPSAPPLRDQVVMQRLIQVVTAEPVPAPGLFSATIADEMNAVRGGNASGKPLHYRDAVFRSGYKDVDPETIAEWTYDLHSFVFSRGGGWENLRNNPQLDMDNTIVPYKTIRDQFARRWWNSHTPAYAKLIGTSRNGWVYDAILDGFDLWYHYLMAFSGISADGVAYFDVTMSMYQNAAWSDIFGQ